MSSTLSTRLRLARWLLPGVGSTGRPRVERRFSPIAEDQPAWTYAPLRRRPVGSVLVVPGLHPDGPADPRLDRFCAVLADAGAHVLAPTLPSYSTLVPTPAVLDEARRSFVALEVSERRPRDVRPGLVSISFGSLPALALCAEVGTERAARLITFGGYADFRATLRFALAGDGDRAHDPLNRPAVFLNLLDLLTTPPRDRARLEAAYRAFVRRTWGRPEMKAPSEYRAVARALIPTVHPDDVRLLELGTGLVQGGADFAADCLERAGSRFDFLDPSPHLARLRVPTTFVHGRDDDVIPFEAAEALARMAHPDAHAKALVTGLYGHTGGAGLGAIRGLGQELAAATGIFADLAACILGR